MCLLCLKFCKHKSPQRVYFEGINVRGNIIIKDFADLFHGLADFCRMGINVRGSLISEKRDSLYPRNIYLLIHSIIIIVKTCKRFIGTLIRRFTVRRHTCMQNQHCTYWCGHAYYVIISLKLSSLLKMRSENT